MSSIHGHILVVDDDKTNRLTLTIGLKQQGHTVVAVENGIQALETLPTQPFDLVLLDIVMPEMNGFEVLTRMKGDAQLRDIPVIIISAVDHMESVVSCIEIGAEDHLPKPFDPVLLQARINASLHKKRSRDHELEYLRQVGSLTDAAKAIESQSFDPASLSGLSTRQDALGTLARVFQRMAKEVYAREHQLEQDNRVKAAFIDVVSHELRSPFVSASLSVELLRRYAERRMVAELRTQIDQLERELGQGRQLIETIISFAGQVGKGSKLNLQDANFGNLIKQGTADLKAMAQKRQIALSYELPSTPLLVAVDKDRMREAIYHLVHNALKFTQQGGAVIVRAFERDGQAVLEVEDNGPGVPPEQLATVWDAFTQSSDRVRRGVEGLGLGLALVRSTVEAHRGEVLASSTPGQGSIFGFALPSAPPSQG